MTVPHRIIEGDEFKKLVDQEGGLEEVTRFVISPYNYDEKMGEGIWMTKLPGVYVLFLNVVDPVLYKDRESKTAMIIANKHMDYGYEDVQDLHPKRGADLYVVHPDGWDISDTDHDLDDADWFYKAKSVKHPKVDIENVLPVEKRGAVH